MNNQMYVEGCSRLVRSCTGIGNLVTQDKLLVECTFELSQFSNDETRLLCTPTERGFQEGVKSNHSFEPGYFMTFEGWTHGGEFLRVTHGGTVGSFDEYDSQDIKGHARLKAGLTISVSVGGLKARTHAKPAFVMVHLANFKCYWMQGVPVYVDSKSVLVVPPIELLIDDRSIKLRPSGSLVDYEAAIERLERFNGVELTSLLEIPISQMEELPKVQNYVESICSVLSLLTGTEVKDLSYDVISERGEIIQSVFGRTGVKKISGFNPFSWVYQSEWKKIVETGVPRFQEAIEAWNVETLIKHFVGSKIDGDSLEERGLKLAVCMEIVRAKFLMRKGKTFIIPEGTFQTSFKKVRKGLKGVLEECFPEIDKQDLDMMLNHAQGLNYYPFRRALKEMCAEVKMYGGDSEAVAKDISTFIEIRNHLVHQGCFVDELEGPAHPLLHERFFQLTFMECFVLKFILSILGYDSAPMRVSESEVHPSSLLRNKAV